MNGDRLLSQVLAIGGGVLTDTVGFACACWRRGIPWCRLPTTLLGQVDASVGIKVMATALAFGLELGLKLG